MIYIWDPKGRVLETHPMPVGVDSPTNCTFGDPDHQTLYITTAGGHLFLVRNSGRRGWIIWPPLSPTGRSAGARTRWRRRRIGCGSSAGPMSAGALHGDGSRLRRGGGKSDDGTGEI
jgi:SMP-30/Gluconolactonase/LRE-like region